MEIGELVLHVTVAAGQAEQGIEAMREAPR